METKPAVVDDLGVIPLFSWYHEVKTMLLHYVSLDMYIKSLNHHTYCSSFGFLQSFDKEMDISGYRFPPLEMVIHFLCTTRKQFFKY